MIYSAVKWIIDKLAVIITIPLIAPALIIIALLIKLTSPGPIFYRGERVGKGGRTFRMFKFRSMVLDAEFKGGFSTANNDPRLTIIGKKIRRYKLDELPQLFNVFLGDMTLVGPRPQVRFYTDKYSSKESQILDVRPGITDLASLYFSDMDSYLGDGNIDSKYELEVEPIKNRLRLFYVKQRSLYLDFQILMKTIFKLAGLEKLADVNPLIQKLNVSG